MTEEIRVAFVGGGLIAKAHAAAQRALPVYHPELPRLRPLVVCDATDDLARSAAARLGFEESAAGWEQTVRRADVDAVVVATPPDLHHDVVLAALAAGKHVLCEKPLALTAAEARAMCVAAEAAGVVHLVGFNLRQAPALKQARAMIREGAVGEISHLTGRYFQDHGRDAGRPMSWRYEAARAGSGALGDVGSHLVDVVRMLAGEIETVTATSRTIVAQRPAASADRPAATAVDVDDYTAFVARFASGAVGTFEVSRVAAGRRNQLAIEINGSHGSLAFDWERSSELLYFAASDAADRQGFRRIVVGPAQPSYPGLLPVAGLGVGFFEGMLLQSAAFARAIAGRAPTTDEATFRDGLRACEVVDAILSSARTGGWTAVSAGARVNGRPRSMRP